MNFKIPLFKTYSNQDDINAVSKIIRRGTYWATGPEIEHFENKITEFTGMRHCASFNSGTSALHAALLSYDFTSGEIIVPSFTFISTANAVVLAGAKPVFAESENQTFGLDAEDVKNRITSKTKSIIAIHYGGMPCKDIKALKEICEDHNLILIEDAAESLGAKTNNKMVGSFGNASMFSFCQNKVITTGEGGVIVTDSEIIAKKLKLIRSHGRVENKTDYFSSTEDNDYIQVGYNFRMSTMSAALGLSQLKKIDKIIKMRRKNAQNYTKNLNSIKEIKTPKESADDFYVYQMYTIQLPDKETRDNLQQHLKSNNIMSKVYFNPVHLKTFYKKTYSYKVGYLPFTENLSRKVLTLPLYATMKNEEIKYVTDKIEEFFR